MKKTKMNCDSLLSGIRLRDGKSKDRTLHNEYDLRNDFDDDYARLIFSSAVRRLQDKAQVFPLDSSDFVRTRLTHSHEVSTLGRSLGISIEENLIKDKKLNARHKGKLSALLAVVGLIHDLGNPPYGHFGEAAIQRYFSNWFTNNTKGKVVCKTLKAEQVGDFTNFEGNAQTFRLLSKLNNLKDEYGYNLSAASLASILKYPRSSIEGNKNSKVRKANNLGVSYKKFGYLQSESIRFQEVKRYTEIDKYRHPASFLLEAADDIAYSAADIEDGCKKMS
ncbi:dGTP triphosphohydrolase [Oceanobacillus picturae]|uniref:dGTP triphosphohydrolase n=1 Tax=Oceanobacillus picturae TaxID=171693 RepID=UPI0021752AD0|nr:dNTP triphosphohydrolase [Oceanobacillus picturae]